VTSRAQAGFHSVEGFRQKTETHNFYPTPLQDSASYLKLKYFSTTFVYLMEKRDYLDQRTIFGG
jgi:hypothetical protein